MLFMIKPLILLTYAVLIGLAFLKKDPRWKIVAVGLVLLILVGREISIDAFVQSESAKLSQQGMLSEGYKDGMSYTLWFIQHTGIFVFVIYAYIFTLCVRGFRHPKPKSD